MFIFNKIFQLAPLANQDNIKNIQNQTLKLFHFINFKSFCVGSNHSQGMQPPIQHPIPFINFQNYWL